MRAVAHVHPAQLAGGRLQVVVDGQLLTADLHRLTVFIRWGALTDDLELVGLVAELILGLLVDDDPSENGCPC